MIWFVIETLSMQIPHETESIPLSTNCDRNIPNKPPTGGLEIISTSSFRDSTYLGLVPPKQESPEAYNFINHPNSPLELTVSLEYFSVTYLAICTLSIFLEESI